MSEEASAAARPMDVWPDPSLTDTAAPRVDAPLDRKRFLEATKQALADFSRPERLAMSPLCRTRVVRKRAGPRADAEARASALRDLMREVAEGLAETRSGDKYLRVLTRTYFNPAESQRLAARSLNLPGTTYRRHLRRGVEYVAAKLWEIDSGGR